MCCRYAPTLLEDVPDMAFKFAAYESLRSLHRRLNAGRPANVQVRRFCAHAHLLLPGIQQQDPQPLQSLAIVVYLGQV